MEIFNQINEIKNIGATAVALGNFDGVHMGHRALISNIVKNAKETGLKSAVFTFRNHPKNTIMKDKPIKNIMYEDEKIRIIESLGVDYMFNLEFTEDIMKMSAEDFTKKLLVDTFNMKAGFCGFNYRFGYKASGNSELLEELGKKWGFTISEMEPFRIDGNIVSSSMIRTLIASGQVDKCEKYLGKNYEIAGEVVVGNRLGRKLGFPTSNLNIDDTMVTPPNGVYVTLCDYNGVRYPSVTNVGNKPTIGEYSKNVETHIFNFDKELYGKNIIVEFLMKTRDEVKFDDFQELSDQIVRDCHEAEAFHREHGNM